MPQAQKLCFMAIAASLALSACTETIIREVTPNGEASTTESSIETPTVGNGANMVPITPDSGTDTPSNGALDNMTPDNADVNTPELTDSTTSTEDSVSTLESGILLQDPAGQTTVGEPGASVDCKQALPCRWISQDTQFSLTVTNADNIASRARLSINYAITTAHDTDVFVSRADDAVDTAGLRFKAADQSLGGGNGGTPQGVIAGTPIEGTLNFDAGTASDTITQWSIAILDGGMLRLPTFTGIPVGTITTAQADCQNTLPCVWSTPLNDIAITLQSVGGISFGSRLTANFSIETATNMTVAVDAGSSAYGSDGTSFEGRTHNLVNETNYLKVSAPATARIPVYGAVNFYRTENIPTSLQLMSLVIYRDRPVPRWNPQFINVPVQ